MTTSMSPRAASDLTDVGLAELTSLEGKVAVVTGGARGLGAAICRRLAEAGASVMVADLDGDAAAAAAARLVASGSRAGHTAVDVRDSAAVDAVVTRTVGELGGLDIWVNNAGLHPFSRPLELDDEGWGRMIATNLDGLFYGCRAAGRHMVDTGTEGVIINLASTISFKSYPNTVHYAAAKAGVLGVTRSLAIDFGPFGIRVNGIAPTYMTTPGTDANTASFREHVGMVPDDLVPMHPLGRLGLPDDVARVAVFLASGLSAFVTGDIIRVDGGILA